MTSGQSRTRRAGIMSMGPSPAPVRALAAAWMLAGALAAFAPAAPAQAASAGAAAAAAPAAGAEEPAGAEAVAPPRHEFGHGLRLGDSGFTLGGYLTGELHQFKGEATQLKSSHASVFLWWEGQGSLKFFGEVDVENLAARRRGDDDGDSDRRVSLERLYLDYAFDDALTLRAGKFLTPIGRWNLRHADPLVWTTNRPLLTQSVFPHNVTGMMASGTVVLREQAISYSLYGSNGTQWNADPHEDPFTTVRGLRLVAPAGPVQLGLSYAHYEQRGSRGQPRRLAGLDLAWAVGRAEFSAEWLRTSAEAGGPVLASSDTPIGAQARPVVAWASDTDGDGPRPPGLGGGGASRGAYLQAVVPVQGQLFAVGRYEWMRDAHLAQTVQQVVLGLAWRPAAALSLKIEYLRPRRPGVPIPDGLAASASVLF